MLSCKQRDFKTLPWLTLDMLVPANHFVREIETKLDLEFVRDLVRDRYTDFGRPSIDPCKVQKFIWTMITVTTEGGVLPT